MKKLMSLFLSLCIMGTMLVGITLPASAATSGITGDCYWKLNGTVLTISGNGNMDSYSTFYQNYMWYTTAPWGWNITQVIIADGVTNIGENAFYNCASLTSVSIPNSVTSIGDRAFIECCSIKDITIPDSVTSIGKWAFSGCRFTSITIPDSVTSIGDYAFEYCDKLTSITIPDSVTSIGSWAFSYCSQLTSITIPDSVASIDGGVFSGCSSLTSITIPDGVTNIGDFAFENCSNLTSIVIPDGVTYIGYGAFGDCIRLKSITISDSVTAIDDAFYNTAYYNNPSNWQDNVLYIGKHLICAKSSVSESYKIKDGTKTIANHAFSYCNNFTSISIPDSVTSIGYGAFYECNNIKNIYYCGTIDQWNAISIDSYNTSLTNATRYYHDYDSNFDVICDAFGCIRKIINYSFLTYTIANGEVTITGCDEAVKGDITLPLELGGYPVTGIDELAFFNCDYITSVVIPDSVTTIDDLAFFDCDGFTSISLPNSVIYIGVDALSDCTSLTNVYYRSLENDKQNIYIDESNASLIDATWYYNSCFWSATHNYDNDLDADCNICGDKREANHTYEAVVISPTCTKKGYTTYTCVSCADSYIADETAALGHSYNNGIITAPTCIKNGYTTYTCTVCDDSYIVDETVALGHSYNNGIVTAPTCTKNGYTTYTCTVCSDSYIANETAALGHSYDNGVVTAPTFTAQGYTTHTCSICGHNYKDNYTAVLNGVQNMQVTATDTNITATWDSPDGVTKYILYVKNSEGETIITRALDADKTSITLSWPNELEWDKTYTIGIRAKTSKWLDTVWKDAALTVAGRIVDVKTQSVGRTIKVDWRAYEGATQYYVYVYKKGEYPTAFSAIEVNGKNSVSIINAIYAEVDYEIRVIATKGVTKMKTINAIPVAARLNVYNPDVFIERGITPTSVGIAWDEIRGVDKCWAYLTPVNGGETIIRETTRGIVGVYNLTPNTEYTVQLQARIVDADGIAHYSGMSDVLGTITTSDWENISFTAKKTEGGAQLTWTPPANVYEYIIYRSTNGGQSYKEIATITDSEVSSYVDAKGKDGYIYAIVTKLKDDFVAVKSGLIKTKLS